MVDSSSSRGMASEVAVNGSTSPAPASHRSPTPELHAAYTTLEILVALVAIVGNVMVIHVFRRERRLRRRTNYYIVSLAVADLLVGLLGIPFAILASVGQPRDLHACLFTVSLLVMLCTISIFSLVAVSVDRYWAILYPMCYSRNVRTKTAITRGGHGGHGGHSSHSGGGHSGGGHSSFGHGSKGSIHGSSYHGGTHYTYQPPRYISYRCGGCSSSSTYPVYHGTPPTIVYMYRESGTRSGDLLAGLALYNLGRASAGHSSHYISADDRCSLQIYDRYHFEENKFPCSLMTSFADSTSRRDPPESNEAHSPNGTLKINYEECVIWHNETHSGYKERIVVSCALLQQYAKTIESRSSLTFWLSLIFIATLISLICCYSFYHKNDNKEDIETTEAAPLSQTIVVEYHSNAPNAVVMNVDCTPTHIYPNH